MKRFLALLIAAVLLLAVYPCVLAEEEYSDSKNYEENSDSEVYEEYKDYKEMKTTYYYSVDGVKLEKSFETSGYNFGSTNIPLAYILRYIGYDVSYDETENCVVATKANDTLKVYIDSEKVVKKTGDIEKEFYVYPHTTVTDDTTYVSQYFFEQVLSFFVKLDYGDFADSERSITVSLTDVAPYGKKISDSFITLIEKQKSMNFDPNAPIIYKTTANINFDSEVFGITVKGGFDADIKYAFKDGVCALDVSLSTKGLYNIYTMLARGNYKEFMPNFSGVDFSKPIDIKLLIDSENIYVKSEDILNLVLNGYEYRNMIDEEKQKVKGQWVKFPISEAGDNIPLNTDYSEIGNKMIISLLNSFEVDKPELFAKMLADTVIDYIGKVQFSSDSATKEDSITVDIDKEWLRKKAVDFSENLVFGYNKDDREAAIKNQKDIVDNFFKVFDYKLSSVTKIKNGAITKGTVNQTMNLLDIPNPLGIKIGKVSLVAVSEYKSIAETEISTSLPTDFIDMEVLKNDEMKNEYIEQSVSKAGNLLSSANRF